jgi:hypothetical protein
VARHQEEFPPPQSQTEKEISHYLREFEKLWTAEAMKPSDVPRQERAMPSSGSNPYRELAFESLSEHIRQVYSRPNVPTTDLGAFGNIAVDGGGHM